MSLKSIGTLSDAIKLMSSSAVETEESLGSVASALIRLSDEQVVAAAKAMGLSAAHTATAMHAKEMAASEIAAELAARGFSKSVAEAALIQAGFTPEVAASTVAQYSFAAAEGTATVATNTFTASVAAATKGLISFLATNPIAWMAVAAAGLYAIYRYNESLRESVAKSVETYRNLTSEVESLDSELKSVRDRMKELEAIDAPTVTDQEELDRLKEYNEQLERELRIKTALQKQSAKDSEDAARKWLEHQEFGKTYDEHGASPSTSSWNEQASQLMQVVGIYRKRLEDAKAAMDAASDDVTSSAFKTAQKQAEAAQKNIDSTLKELSELYSNIKDNVIEAIGDEADTDWAKEILALWDNFEKDYADLLDGGATPTIEKTQEATDSAAESVSAYTAQLSSLSDVISDLKSSYDALADAQSDMDAGGGLSTATIEKLAKENENYLDYLYEENGVIKLNTEAWKENADAKMQGEMAEIQKEIDSLNERNKVLLESIAYFEQMKDTDSNIGMWDQEIAKARAEIEKNTDAVKDNQDLMSLYTAIFGQMRSDSDEAFSSLTDRLTLITEQYDILTNAQEEFAKSGILSASTLSSIADKFPEMEDSVSLYIAGLKTSQELLEELSIAYGVDYANYESAVKAKLRTSETFYNSLTDDQKQLISELSKSYGIDLDNFKTIEEKKLAFQAEIIKQLAANYSKYAGASLEELQDQYENAIWSGGVDRAEAQALRKTIEAIEKYNRTLNSIASGVGLTSVYNPKNIKSSSGSSSSSKEAKEIEEYTATINEYREAEERLRQVQEDRSGIERQIDNSEDLKEQISLRKQLIDVYQQEQNALHNLNNQRDAAITAGVQSLRSLGFEVQYNADTNYLWISNMERLNELVADSKGEYDTLQEATNALRKETEDLIGTLEDLNEENREGSSTWWDLKDSIRDAKVAIINDLKDIVNQASDAVDEIQSVADTLYDAADEFAANDGFITIDTWQKIKDLDDKYLQLLKDENNQWLINEERVNAVIAARTRQLAVENAMSYVERIKLATQEGTVENLNDLIFVTTDATNSTWGLVYAELELMHTMGDLSDSQYQAALHNIQAMQDLAENAVQNIGKATDAVARNLEETRKQLEDTKKGLQDTLDELEDMQDGAGNLVDYVMDMLKHRIQQQINLLGEMKDKYSEIIDLKKKSLDATKKEQDYQKTISKKLKELAKLQERIDALSLDDSRSAQAERAKLLEQMAELQEDLVDTQASNSIEAQKEALDKMKEDYHAEKDGEIKILEESISSTQKLYNMAIEYIHNNWDTLYSELIAWNTEYGTSLNSEIDTAFEAAQAAAQRFGDFVSAIMGGISAEIDDITRQIEALDEQMSNLSISTSSGGGVVGETDAGDKNTTVGNRTEHASPTDEDMVRTIVGWMKECSAAWSAENDKATNDALHQRAVDLAGQLDQYGVHADYRNSDGTWWITQDKLNPSNVGKLLHDCYHTGGFVDDEPLKPNERYIKAEDGELVLTSSQQDSFAAQIDRFKTMADAFSRSVTVMPVSAENLWPNGVGTGGSSSISNVTNNNQPTEIHMGDITINAPSGNGKVIADEVREITRANLNQISRMLRRP